jgi:NAD(P)-dependent dehydrogenase (short-subunit alcohol dehydrogenase family)
MNLLSSKVVIVTGGSGLLGREIVKKLNSEGAVVINLDISNQLSDDFQTYKCDITNSAEVDICVSKILEKYKKIDGLVNNAYPRSNDWSKKFEDIEYSSWRLNLDIQLNSAFYITQKVSKFMMVNKAGSIVNMASVYGIVGPDFNIYEGTSMTMPAAYSAIKGGLISFTRYLASYLGPYNVRVNSISPGGIFDNQPTTFVNNYENKVPMRRMGRPDDISPLVCFLLSHESSYITGQNIAIDGGWTAI